MKFHTSGMYFGYVNHVDRMLYIKFVDSFPSRFVVPIKFPISDNNGYEY